MWSPLVHGMPTDDYSFPYVAGWAGEEPDKAIRETQARVNVAARAIIAESPAEQTAGSKPPGTDLAVAAARQLDGRGGDTKRRRDDPAGRTTVSEATAELQGT